MNKKILLSTTIASAMFITGMAMPATLASTEVPEAKTVYAHQFKSDWVSTGIKSISIELEAGQTALTQSELVKLVEAEYSKGVVASINGAEVNPTANVGTGAIVKLQSGKEFTVVLFGDANGDGKITNQDALAALKAQKANNLSDAERKAADVMATGESNGVSAINNSDALRLLRYAVKHTSVNNQKLADEVKLPEEETIGVLHINNASVTATPANVVDPVKTVAKADVDGNNITIYVNKAEVKSDDKDATLTFNTGVASTPEEVVAGVNVSGTTATVTITDVTDTTAKKAFTLKTDAGEKINVNVSIVDVPTPVASGVVKGINRADETFDLNMDKVADPTIDTSAKTIAVSAKVNTMTTTTRNNVEGKWYALVLKTDTLASDILVEGAEKGEGLGAGEKDVVVWLNANNGATTVTLKHKNAVDARDKTEYTVNVTNNSKTLVSAADIVANNATIEGVSDVTDKFAANQNAVTVTEGATNSTAVTVKADLLAMSEYARAAKGTTVKETGVWYALQLTLDGSLKDRTKFDFTGINYNPASDAIDVTGTDTDKICLWLEAKEGTQTITLTEKAVEGEPEGTPKEKIEIKVTLVNISTPKILSAVKVEGANSTGIYNPAVTTENPDTTGVTVSADGNDVIVQGNTNAMTTSKRKVGTTDVEAKWYGITVDTGVDGIETDEVTTPYEINGSKITLWLKATEDANAVTTIVTVKNSKDTTVTKAINVKFTDNRKVKITTPTVATLNSELASEDVMGEAKYLDLKNNNVCATIGSETDGKYAVTANLQAMKTFNLDGVDGKWIAVVVDTNVLKETLVDHKDIYDLRYFGATASTKTVIWVDASKEESTITLKNNATPQETATITFKVTDNSNMKLNGALMAKSTDIDLGDTAKSEALTNNMKYVKIDKVEGNTVTLKVNKAKLQEYRNGAGTLGKWYGILLDLGYVTADYKSGTYDIGNGLEQLGTSQWVPTGDDKKPVASSSIKNSTVTDANLILFWLDATKDYKLTLKADTKAEVVAADTDPVTPAVNALETYEFNVVVVDDATLGVE